MGNICALLLCNKKTDKYTDKKGVYLAWPHAVCNSTLDATVIQLSALSTKPSQNLIDESFAVIMNTKLMTMTSGSSKEPPCQTPFLNHNPFNTIMEWDSL